jgi:hypothetical protein
MKERVFENNLIFELDSNGDNYESFKKAVEIIRSLPGFREQKYHLGFFDDALLCCNCDGVDVKLEYSGFMGTELKVADNTIESDLYKVRQWALEIYNFIHNKKSPI